MSDEGEHTALYDDLTDAPITSIAAVTTAPVSTLFAGTQDPVLSEKLTHLEKRVKELEDENANLKRNMGTLFRTAKKEIKRKDDQIVQMMLELDEKS